MSESGPALSNLSVESRSFPPSDEFAAQANAAEDWYARADADREAFWAEQADRLSWAHKWDTVLEWDAPFAKWFVGGKLNVAHNCIDRHVEAGNGDRVAFHWEGEPGDARTITYADLLREVCKAANALTELAVRAGDRVAIQLPMIPEAVFAMLACARLGAVHSVGFGGFSSSALRSRIDDAQARLLITSDGQYRRGKPAPMKENTDQAVAQTPTIEHVLVVRRTEADVPWTDGRDVWWHDIVDGQSETHVAQAFDAQHPLYILYTLGTTGSPKGVRRRRRRDLAAGRVDDVMNMSGYRISTTEVESALVSHPTLVEAAVVGASDATTGQGIVAFVILRGNVGKDEASGADGIKALRDHIAKEIGPIAKPRQIMVVDELPRPARARSCDDCCATWRRTAKSATSRHWPTPP